MRVLRGASAARFVGKLEQRGRLSLAGVERQVRRIVEEVRKSGDRALRRYAEKWDGLQPRQAISVADREMEQAWNSTSDNFKQALKAAAANIRQYCEWQMPQGWRRSLAPGIEVGQILRPLESAGCYVPGGRHPLPSTLLMTVIPAQVAGVKQIRIVSPRPAPESLAAAFFLGIREF